MKKLVFILAVLMAFTAKAADLNDFLAALNQIEASGRHTDVPTGDNGKAIGPFQIHKDYWADATDFDPSIGGDYEDCEDYEYSVRIVKAYLRRYASRQMAQKNWREVARIHNGGPKGHKRSSTVGYANRVVNSLNTRSPPNIQISRGD